MDKYTAYILDKCLNDKNEATLHLEIKIAAEMHILGFTNVELFISQLKEIIITWVAHLLPKQNVLEVVHLISFMKDKTMKGYDFIPAENILAKEPTDAKDNFYKHFAITLGVDYTKLSFEIYKHYKEVLKNGDR